MLTHQLYLQKLRESEDYDSVRFDAFRATPLEKLLDHIWRTAPFHRSRIAVIVNDGTLDMTRWTEIPLLRPGDIKQHAMALAAGEAPDHVEEQASNSFAEIPFMSRLARIVSECTLERFYEHCDLDLSATLGILLPDWVGEDEGLGWSVTIADSPWFAGDFTAPADAQADFLAEHDIAILKTTRENARRLATHAPPPLDAVVITDDAVTDADRSDLGKAFGCRIAHLVTRPVLGACAMSIDSGEPYHAAAATALIEVVDENGRQIGPGERGELVVTPLYEIAYPLLRLATGIGATAPISAGTEFGVRSLANIHRRVS